MAYNKSGSGIPANASETVNVPASGGRSKSVNFSNKRQSYGKDLGGGMGAPADLSSVPASGRAKNKISFPSNPFKGAKAPGPVKVSYKEVGG